MASQEVKHSNAVGHPTKPSQFELCRHLSCALHSSLLVE